MKMSRSDYSTAFNFIGDDINLYLANYSTGVRVLVEGKVEDAESELVDVVKRRALTLEPALYTKLGSLIQKPFSAVALLEDGILTLIRGKDLQEDDLYVYHCNLPEHSKMVYLVIDKEDLDKLDPNQTLELQLALDEALMAYTFYVVNDLERDIHNLVIVSKGKIDIIERKFLRLAEDIELITKKKELTKSDGNMLNRLRAEYIRYRDLVEWIALHKHKVSQALKLFIELNV